MRAVIPYRYEASATLTSDAFLSRNTPTAPRRILAAGSSEVMHKVRIRESGYKDTPMFL